MSDDAWVHVLVEGRTNVDTLVRRLGPSGLVCRIDGAIAGDLNGFLREAARAIPLIRGFGGNLNALMDLIRTFGWGEHAGHSHCLIWHRADRLMSESPVAFRLVVDILVGVAKELLVGEELDPTFDPTIEADWVPTRLDIIFLVASERDAVAVGEMAGLLSDDWEDEFGSLAVPVDIIV